MERPIDARVVKRGFINPKFNVNLLHEIFEAVTRLNRPGDYWRNVRILTEKIENTFVIAQNDLSEKEEEIRKANLEKGELIRQNMLMERQVLEQQEEIARLSGELEKENWGNCEVGVNVSKMRMAVTDLHGTFGAMIDSLRSTHISLGTMRQEPPSTPHDVEELKVEVDSLFLQVQTKLKKWERNQKEMQEEMGQTREVLERLLEQLMSARKSVSSSSQRAPVLVSPPRNLPVLSPLLIHQSMLSVIHPRLVAVSTPSPSPTSPLLLPVLKDDGGVPVAHPDNTITFHAVVEDVMMTEQPGTILVASSSVVESAPSSPPGAQQSPTSASHKCEKCGEGFSTLVQLRIHSKVIHKEPSSTTLSPREQDSPPQSSKRTKLSPDLTGPMDYQSS